jgi:transcriptional regulator with XRE-family HTH domain
MSFDTIVQRLIKKKPSFKKEYLQHNPYIEVSNLITAARIYKGFSQEELARLVGGKQSSIARLESGKFLPNVASLDKIAKALGSYLVIRFGFMEEAPVPTYILNITTIDSSIGVPNIISSQNTISGDANASLIIHTMVMEDKY